VNVSNRGRLRDKEDVVLRNGLRLLSQVGVDARRRILAYWGARAETLPLTDASGRVLDEAPVEHEPPVIKFIHEHQQQQQAAESRSP
jgi:hypothetical protein